MTFPTSTFGPQANDHGGYLSNARQLDRGFCDPELTNPIHRFSYFTWRAGRVLTYSVVDPSAARI
jgi:hypothetical protein